MGVSDIFGPVLSLSRVDEADFVPAVASEGSASQSVARWALKFAKGIVVSPFRSMEVQSPAGACAQKKILQRGPLQASNPLVRDLLSWRDIRPSLQAVLLCPRPGWGRPGLRNRRDSAPRV